MISDIKTERNYKLNNSQLFASILEKLTPQEELCHQVHKKSLLKTVIGHLWTEKQKFAYGRFHRGREMTTIELGFFVLR